MSASIEVTSLADALSYETALPLEWLPLTTPLDPLTLEQMGLDNLRILSAVATLDEQRGAPVSTGDETGPLEGEIARLHQKLNLLVDLVALLVSQQAPALSLRPVRLSWSGLRWSDATAAGAGLVKLRLHAGVPQSFAWPATVVHRDGGVVEARFEPMAEALQAALEKHVFVHHRRAIAGNRRPGQA